MVHAHKLPRTNGERKKREKSNAPNVYFRKETIKRVGERERVKEKMRKDAGQQTM